MTTVTMTLPDPHTQSAFYADVPVKRLLAYIFDVVVVFCFAFGFSLLTFGLGFFVFFGLAAIIGFFYRVMTLASGSATWGMRFMSIELRTAQGDRFDLGHAVLHTAGTLISFAVAPLQLISVVLMLVTPKRQGLTDHVLGTVAINRTARF